MWDRSFALDVFLGVKSIMLDPLLERRPQAVGVRVAERSIVLEQKFKENF